MESVICGNRAELKRRAQSRRAGGRLVRVGCEGGQPITFQAAESTERAEKEPALSGEGPRSAHGARRDPTDRANNGAQSPRRAAPGTAGGRRAWRPGRREVLLAGPPTQKQAQGDPGGHPEILTETLCPRPGRQAVYVLFYFAHFFFSLNQTCVTFVIRNTKMRGVQDG